MSLLDLSGLATRNFYDEPEKGDADGPDMVTESRSVCSSAYVNYSTSVNNSVTDREDAVSSQPSLVSDRFL